MIDVNYMAYLALKQKRFDIYDNNKEDIIDNISSKPMKIFIFIIFTLTLIFGSIITYKLVIQKIVIESTCFKSEICSINVIFDNEEDYIAYINNIDYNLNQIPKFIKEKFSEDKWKIYITNEQMAESGLYWGLKDKTDIVGATSIIHKYIIIPNDNRSIDMSIIHEMGHYIDNFKYTYSDEWEKIFMEEKFAYYREYARTNKTEAFACEFMEYIQLPEDLKNRAPKTYDFINNIVNTLRTQ